MKVNIYTLKNNEIITATRLMNGIGFHDNVKRLDYRQEDDKEFDINNCDLDCDVAVIFWSPNYLAGFEGRVRSKIYNELFIKQKKPVVIIETAIIRGTKLLYHRIGLNDVVNTKGIFIIPDKKYGEERWNTHFAPFRPLREYKIRNNGYILVCKQLPHDYALYSANEFQALYETYENWLNQVIKKINKYFDRPIIIREHPAIRKPLCSLEEHLKQCYATISFNSGSGVDSIINGVPTYAESVSTSFAKEYARPINAWSSLYTIDYPSYIDGLQRIHWLSRLAYHQWNIEEISNGIAWKHVKELI